MKKNSIFNKMLPLFGVLLSCVLMMCIGINVSAANTQPTDLKQTAAAATKVTIGWTAPSTQAGNSYNRIMFQCSKDGKTWVDKGAIDSKVTSATLIGIERGTSQYVRIKAVSYNEATKKILVDGAWSEAIEVATIPYSVSGITQTASTKTKATFTWPEARGANCYDVYVGTSYSNAKFKGRMTGRSVEVKGKQGYGYYVKVVPVRITINNAENNRYAALGMETWGTVKTNPKAVTLSKENSWERGSKSIDFTWTSSNKKVDGYQVKIYDSKSKVKATVNTKKTSYTFNKAKSNQYYKIKVRPYINVNDKKKYGSWSATGVSLMAPQITGVSQEDNKATVTWAAVKGASAYDIYAGSYPDIESMTKIGTSNSTTFVTNAVQNNAAVTTNKRIYFCVKATKTVKGKTYTSLASDAGFSN
ncbi:MAG: fibronectin type III domain-containing protein [Roseburia sp.]|nr:fibronectin type III domain-containing protein [Roseburia sp.]MCM1278447.1 fibronectin type III domain-containing protein [Robinsoniella sp.]